MSIDEMIRRSVSCAKCGAKGVGNCRCWITLRCARCKRSMTVERQPIDPPAAELCETVFCNECDQGGEFDDITYYDEHGREVSGDTGP